MPGPFGRFVCTADWVESLLMVSQTIFCESFYGDYPTPNKMIFAAGTLFFLRAAMVART